MSSKNPLNAMFGTFLQLERKRMVDETIDTLCEKGKLSISVSLYKMIESGHTSFNINKIYDLIKVFYESGFLFDRLAKFIAGQNIIDSLMNGQEKSAKGAFSDLADPDTEFKYLYEKVEEYFEFEEGSKEQKEFLQKTAAAEIRSFLTKEKYPMANTVKFEGELVKELKKVPSLSVELLVTFINSFAKINPQHFGHIASNWEEANHQSFESVDGYYLDTKSIVDDKNLAIYNYPYLLENDFSKIRYIFQTGLNHQQVERDFKSILNQCRIKNKFSEIEDDVFSKKVHFKTIENNKPSLNNLLRDPADTEILLRAFWVFTTKTGNKIAFVGVNQGDVNIVYNLTYQEALERSKSFDVIWNSL